MKGGRKERRREGKGGRGERTGKARKGQEGLYEGRKEGC
jgi:hypothetical protein